MTAEHKNQIRERFNKLQINDGRVELFRSQVLDLIYSEIQTQLQGQVERIEEKLDEMAFENDNGYKVELFINWDKARPLLQSYKNEGKI